MSLDTDEVEQEQNEMKDLQRQLRDTTLLVKTLSTQLNDLREKVSCLKSNERETMKAERRRAEKERERFGLLSLIT